MPSEEFSRKKLTFLSDLPKGGEDKFYLDEQDDKLKIEGCNLKLSIFKRVGIRNGEIKYSSLRQCIFEDCYFRNAEFRCVDFTGSLFINCNLGQAKFQNCTFDYVRFDRTIIDSKEILANLPTSPNLRRNLSQELRTNAMSIGNAKEADTFILEEIKADRIHNWNKLIQRNSFYRKKYGLWDQIAAGWHLIILTFSDQIWGYGLRIGRILRNVLVIFLLFAWIYWQFGLEWTTSPTSPPSSMSIPDSLYASMSGLTGGLFGDIQPSSVGARLFGSIEAFIGIVLLGFFVAALYRKIAK